MTPFPDYWGNMNSYMKQMALKNKMPRCNVASTIHSGKLLPTHAISQIPLWRMHLWHQCCVWPRRYLIRCFQNGFRLGINLGWRWGFSNSWCPPTQWMMKIHNNKLEWKKWRGLAAEINLVVLRHFWACWGGPCTLYGAPSETQSNTVPPQSSTYELTSNLTRRWKPPKNNHMGHPKPNRITHASNNNWSGVILDNVIIINNIK